MNYMTLDQYWTVVKFLKGYEAILLGYIVYRGGEIQLSQAKLQYITGLCSESVQKATRQLEASGYIEVDRETLPFTLRAVL